MKNQITLRAAKESDHYFILGLSPRLSEVANLPWHAQHVVQKMQDEYITLNLAQKAVPNITLVAEHDEKLLGFIHACAHEDSISRETCGKVPLLAVTPEAQGMGIGQLLMESVENWSKKQGYRILHLEVFANNLNAQGFYQSIGYEAETIQMIKPI